MSTIQELSFSPRECLIAVQKLASKNVFEAQGLKYETEIGIEEPIRVLGEKIAGKDQENSYHKVEEQYYHSFQSYVNKLCDEFLKFFKKVKETCVNGKPILFTLSRLDSALLALNKLIGSHSIKLVRPCLEELYEDSKDIKSDHLAIWDPHKKKRNKFTKKFHLQASEISESARLNNSCDLPVKTLLCNVVYGYRTIESLLGDNSNLGSFGEYLDSLTRLQRHYQEQRQLGDKILDILTDD